MLAAPRHASKASKIALATKRGFPMGSRVVLHGHENTNFNDTHTKVVGTKANRSTLDVDGVEDKINVKPGNNKLEESKDAKSSVPSRKSSSSSKKFEEA